jgi:hypothetical protein
MSTTPRHQFTSTAGLLPYLVATASTESSCAACTHHRHIHTPYAHRHNIHAGWKTPAHACAAAPSHTRAHAGRRAPTDHLPTSGESDVGMAMVAGGNPGALNCTTMGSAVVAGPECCPSTSTNTIRSFSGPVTAASLVTMITARAMPWRQCVCVCVCECVRAVSLCVFVWVCACACVQSVCVYSCECARVREEGARGLSQGVSAAVALTDSVRLQPHTLSNSSSAQAQWCNERVTVNARCTRCARCSGCARATSAGRCARRPRDRGLWAQVHTHARGDQTDERRQAGRKEAR